jgi:hypothetical protein
MTQINQERMEAILHLAGQIDLQITELSEEMESINIRLESLRALSTQIFNVQDGTLSNEEVHALAQAGKEADGGEGNPSPEYIVDEIIAEEITLSPE